MQEYLVEHVEIETEAGVIQVTRYSCKDETGYPKGYTDIVYPNNTGEREDYLDIESPYLLDEIKEDFLSTLKE